MSLRDRIFEFYENHVMGSRLGRSRLAVWISDALYSLLFRSWR